MNNKSLIWVNHCNNIKWEALSNLYKIAPLGDKSIELLELAFQNSMFKYFVYNKHKLIGAGRALADGVDSALDWLVSSDAIVAKSTVVISASTSAMGGDKVHAQLVALLKVISQNVLEDASLIVARVNKKIDDAGNVVDDSLKEELERVMKCIVGT